MGVTEKLARFIAETPAGSIPPAAIASAKLRFLDTLGVALGGSRHASTKIALDTARMLGGNAQASIIGSPDRTSVELAGFVNGVAAHALEYDDYTRMVTHLSASLVPGALAVSPRPSMVQVTTTWQQWSEGWETPGNSQRIQLRCACTLGTPQRQPQSMG